SKARQGLVPDQLQSTLQHELGHAFGLTHSWSAGYAPQGSPDIYSECDGVSLMSYNMLHWTSGDLRPSQLWLDSRTYKDCASLAGGSGIDLILLPEEINNLSLNKRVFPNLYFDPEADQTKSTIERTTQYLGTLTLPFEPFYGSQKFALDNGFYL